MGKGYGILLAFIIVKFLLQYFLILPEYDLHRDEYLHLDQANHLDWGYLSVPPVTSWMALVIKWLGNGVFWVRFFPAALGALTMLVVWKTVETVGGGLFARVLAASCILFSALLRVNQLFQPNSMDVLCWTTLYFILVKYISSRNTRWLYAFAVVFAFGFLNKYNVIFLLAGLFPAILLTPHRTVFLKKETWFALGIGLLLISPNLLWQYQNNFPVVHHMQELAKTQLVNVSRADFLGEQLIYFMGSLPVILGGLVGLLIFKPLAPYKLFFYSIIFTLAIFTLLRAKGYYAIGIYPVYVAFGAVFWSQRWKMLWLRAGLIALPIMIFTRMLTVAFPNKTPEEIVEHPDTYRRLGMLRWEDGKEHPLPQDFADMLGWKELAAKVDAAYLTIPEPEKTLVLCDNYGQAGAINFYTRQKLRAVTFNADYINWFDLKTKYKHLIRVKNGWERTNEMLETAPLFGKAFAADSVTTPYSREQGTTIFVFENAKVDINAKIEAEIAESRW